MGPNVRSLGASCKETPNPFRSTRSKYLGRWERLLRGIFYWVGSHGKRWINGFVAFTKYTLNLIMSLENCFVSVINNHTAPVIQDSTLATSIFHALGTLSCGGLCKFANLTNSSRIICYLCKHPFHLLALQGIHAILVFKRYD